jgi:hypothetical protein
MKDLAPRHHSWTLAMNVSGPQYNSPAVLYDPLAQVLIVQRVDPDTGEVTSQTPTEATVRHERITALGGATPSAPAAQSPKAEPPAPVTEAPTTATSRTATVHPPVSLLV